jgi:serine/threonine-protein kinase
MTTIVNRGRAARDRVISSPAGSVERQAIGKYQIISRIGQGAMGEVFKAHDPLLNRMVAVKTISSSLGTESELRRRFLREAQSAARLNHPNIITVLDFGEEQGQIFMAMELLEGSDLKDLIGTHMLPDLDGRLDVMEQVCEGLAYAHSMEVVHRDLKPSNIHVLPSGRVKILDFGLARLGASEMTRTGMVMGTPHYMSPEQVRGEKVDVRSDVFALGAMFYELLAERKAFEGDSMHTVLYQVLEEQPEPLRNWVHLPPMLGEVVEKALQKDAAARFADASELLAAVRAVRRALADPRAEALSGSEMGGLPPGALRGPADPRVVGAVALRPEPESGPPAPATLSAEAPTQVDPRRARFPPRVASSSSRAPLYLGGGLALVGLLLAGGFALAIRQPLPAAPRVGPRPLNDLTRALVASQVELARNKLDEKSYRDAATRADQALRLDPTNDEARQLLARARGALQELDAADAEARAALAAGDAEKAAQGLWSVLLLDPHHEGINGLVAPLNPVFRDRAARAKELMSEARAAADRAKASAQAGFAAGVSAGADGDWLLSKKQYAAAAARYLDARDEFERARRSVQR